jgi:hypothetical protein
MNCYIDFYLVLSWISCPIGRVLLNVSHVAGLAILCCALIPKGGKLDRQSTHGRICTDALAQLVLLALHETSFASRLTCAVCVYLNAHHLCSPVSLPPLSASYQHITSLLPCLCFYVCVCLTARTGRSLANPNLTPSWHDFFNPSQDGAVMAGSGTIFRVMDWLTMGGVFKSSQGHGHACGSGVRVGVKYPVYFSKPECTTWKNQIQYLPRGLTREN